MEERVALVVSTHHLSILNMAYGNPVHVKTVHWKTESSGAPAFAPVPNNVGRATHITCGTTLFALDHSSNNVSMGHIVQSLAKCGERGRRDRVDLTHCYKGTSAVAFNAGTLRI